MFSRARSARNQCPPRWASTAAPHSCAMSTTAARLNKNPEPLGSAPSKAVQSETLRKSSVALARVSTVSSIVWKPTMTASR